LATSDENGGKSFGGPCPYDSDVTPKYDPPPTNFNINNDPPSRLPSFLAAVKDCTAYTACMTMAAAADDGSNTYADAYCHQQPLTRYNCTARALTDDSDDNYDDEK